MLSTEQIAFYHEHGYLHMPAVFTADETAQLQEDLDWMIKTWANVGVGWTGPWRKQIMDLETEAKSKLIAMHDLHFYSQPWMTGITKASIAESMSQLLSSESEAANGGAPVELHHSTMHVKPCQTGHPFPMHQDHAFYGHVDNRFIDALVHLDDTEHANGEIRFIDGSHKLGYLEHITSFVNDAGEKEVCTPHLDQNVYRLEDTVAVPAKAGDLVIFNINTIHGSYTNTTDNMRRLVRVGYRHPDNTQTFGQSCGRPSLMLKGRRARAEGQLLFGIDGPTDAAGNSAHEAFGVKL
jgi:phytanoyl-CoA hydroxylase